jgi:hypothetical protein
MHRDELHVRFAQLDRAVAARDVLERRLAADPHDDVLRRRSLAACEQVLRARAALHRCLMRQGWRPPPHVVRALLDDELLLDEPLGGAGG